MNYFIFQKWVEQIAMNTHGCKYHQWYLHIDENDRSGWKVKIFICAFSKIVVDPELLMNKGTSSGIGHFQNLEYLF